MKNQIKSTHSYANIAKNLGWSITKLMWFRDAAREYVRLHGAETLLGMK